MSKKTTRYRTKVLLPEPETDQDREIVEAIRQLQEAIAASEDTEKEAREEA